jgi:predicted Fe-S protein YdhL (DUF1289 family)
MPRARTRDATFAEAHVFLHLQHPTPATRRRRRLGDLVTAAYRAVLSPCIGICNLGEDGLCEGCHRTSSEIAAWSYMNDDQRLRLMESVLPLREARAKGRE